MSSLNFSTLNTADPAEHGSVVELENPFTGETLIGDDGAPVTWTLRGEDAPAVRRVIKRQQDKRNERVRKGRDLDLGSDTLESERIDRLVAATITYSGNFTLDDNPLPYSEANARRLLTDARFPWLAEQLASALGDRKRFLTSSSTP